MLLFSHIFFTNEFCIFALRMSHFIDIHTHHPLQDRLGLRNVRLGKEVVAGEKHISLGVHPWDVNAESEELLRELQQADCEAIGEIGLDRCCNVHFDVQQHYFDQQLQVAEERNLPIIIHCVRAYNEVLQELDKHRLSGVIFHGFIGSSQLLQQIVDKGHCVSFGFGALRSPKTIDALRVAPLDRVFLESDESPTPIEDLYTEVASIRGIDTEVLKQQIYHNYKRIFG